MNFGVANTRRTQPYADPFNRPQTPVLAAMLQGRPHNAPNPIDHKRQMMMLARLILGRGFAGN